MGTGGNFPSRVGASSKRKGENGFAKAAFSRGASARRLCDEGVHQMMSPHFSVVSRWEHVPVVPLP